MSNLSVADVLERAADLIEPEGKWGQGAFGSVFTCMCAEGAIYIAARPDPDEALGDKAANFAGDLCPYVGHNIDRLVAWNDAEGRTQSEVVLKLREAAALARAKGPSND